MISAIAGVALVVIARFTALFLADAFPWLVELKSRYADFQFFGTGALTLILGVILAEPLNLILASCVSLYDRSRLLAFIVFGQLGKLFAWMRRDRYGACRNKARDRSKSFIYRARLIKYSLLKSGADFWKNNDEFNEQAFFRKVLNIRKNKLDRIERTIIFTFLTDNLHKKLLSAQTQRSYVAINLNSSSKVITGLVINLPPDLSARDASVIIRTLATGYRDKNQNLIITNWYDEVFRYLMLPWHKRPYIEGVM